MDSDVVDRDVVDRSAPLAVVGAGVIGGGWAARMVLAGYQVRVYDPSDQAESILNQMVDRARLAWEQLEVLNRPMGQLQVVGSISEAVSGAAFVQESVPEDPELKAKVHRQIEDLVGAEVIIASSTSGIRPSVMQQVMEHPARLVVGHPFNPVYLLPLVEVVGGEHTSDATIAQVQRWYRDLGMRPLHVRVEIDAFIADRLLEAVWREALWLVNDGVATTAEIDEAITHGFGLRWAQMGLFETYRVAGGPGGFRHFIEQFGPALDWPWTKLTDTPEFTPELIDRLVEQSDAQSGHHSLEDLERIRDQNLIGILKVLETNRWGAGQVVANQRSVP